MVDPYNHWCIDILHKKEETMVIHKLMKNGKYMPFVFINNETGENIPVFRVDQNKDNKKELTLIKGKTKRKVICSHWELALRN